MKNAFDFILKALFVLKIIKLNLNSFIRNTSLISEFMASQPVQHTITIHVLPKISQNKDKQETKFGQTTEYN